MARDVGETKPVRAAALAFLTATLAARSAYVHQSSGTAPTRMPAADDNNLGCPASIAVQECTSGCADSMQHRSHGDAHVPVSTSDTSCQDASSSESHGLKFAWHHDQQIWDLLPSLLKVSLPPAKVHWCIWCIPIAGVDYTAMFLWLSQTVSEPGNCNGNVTEVEEK